jgi:predicted phosphohydrolase
MSHVSCLLFGKHQALWYHNAVIWTISDLHLSSVNPKPMDIFGDRWRNHPQRIAAAWRERVQSDDTVLIAGDISWALKLPEALPDLQWIAELPGRKVLSRGNHDYWWESAGRVRRQLPPSLAVVQGDALDLGDAVVCGTRGWITPETPGFTPAEDQVVYNRELVRLDLALSAAHKLAAETKPIIVMFHYPPFLDRRPTEFAQRMAAAGVAACIYGHLHRPHDWATATQGIVDGVYYQLTSCDYLGFGPVAVRGLDRPTQMVD